MLTEEEKRAVLQQKIIFWTNAMTEDLCRETGTPAGVVEDLGPVVQKSVNESMSAGMPSLISIPGIVLIISKYMGCHCP